MSPLHGNRANRCWFRVCLGWLFPMAILIIVRWPTMGTEAHDNFLKKPSTQRVIAAPGAGLSLRQAAVQVEVSVNTVRKVQTVLRNA